MVPQLQFQLLDLKEKISFRHFIGYQVWLWVHDTLRTWSSSIWVCLDVFRIFLTSYFFWYFSIALHSAYPLVLFLVPVCAQLYIYWINLLSLYMYFLWWWNDTKKKGKKWHKIAHIPCIHIDDWVILGAKIPI